MKTTNVFLNLIADKTALSFKTFFKYFRHKRKVKKFRNDIINGSPSFGLLWKMSDFIKGAEKIFFYDNSTKNTDIGLFSSKGYAPGNNGFKINTEECFIVVKLFSDDQKVMIELERRTGECMKTLFIFENENWTSEHNFYDEMLLEQVIKVINNKMIRLFDYCYDLR